MTSDAGLVQSVDRALILMEILGRDGPTGVSDLARQLGIHKSTVFRLLATLQRRGLVEQHPVDQRYGLGMALIRLARSVREELDVVALARPASEELSRVTGETVNISVLEGGTVINLEEVNRSDSLLGVSWLGRHTSLHNTSNGKVFLAFMDHEQARQALAGPLTSTTEHTVVDPDVLTAQLEQVRETGYAWQYEELEPGLAAVAAPIRDAGGGVLATISIAGPAFRMTVQRMPELGHLAAQAAAGVSDRLGFPTPAR